MKNADQLLDEYRQNEHEEVPHLTVARVKSAKNKELLRGTLEEVKNESFGEMIINKLVLYESEPDSSAWDRSYKQNRNEKKYRKTEPQHSSTSRKRVIRYLSQTRTQ